MGLSLRLVVVLLLVLPATARAEELAWLPATKALFARPSAEAPSLVVAAGGWLSVRLGRRQGKFIAVETVPPPHACVAHDELLAQLRLHGFVRPRDLTTLVTTRALRVELGGGAQALVSAGNLVRRDTNDAAWVDHIKPLRIPVDAVGTSYTPPPSQEETVAAQLSAGPLEFGRIGQLQAHGGESVYAVDAEGDVRWVTIGDPCIRYRLRVPAARVQPAEAQVLGGLVGVGNGDLRVRAGARAYWSDGTPAGTVATAIFMSLGAPTASTTATSHGATPVPSRRCLALQPQGTFCFDAADVASAPR